MDNNNQQITVTSPLLPPLEEFIPYLEDIWQRKWITNNGHYHQLLEKSLAEYLGVEYISVFTNGTLPLITALQALRITGEVITTPYSFVATIHSLWWNGIKPVFVDVDPITGCLNPAKIEAAITPKTTAIMPVHVYGNPCDTEAIQSIADKYGLKIIYDAAHAFGVKVGTTSPTPALPSGGWSQSPLRGDSGGLLREDSRRLYHTADPALYDLLKGYAEEMRKKPTQAEAIVWEILRGKNLDAKFRRQHIIGDYIVDFVCLDKQLVIEIDGEYHNEWEQQVNDAERTEWLQSRGFTVIRFTNAQVVADTDTVVDTIKQALSPTPALPSGGGSKSPLRGDIGGLSILKAGDISTLSFHATKTYNTVEGGALISPDEKTKKRIDYLKNFGFAGETEVVAPGINSKMDEIRAAYGLLNLRHVDAAIDARHQVAIRYREALRGVEGIRVLEDIPGVRHNYSYFPVFIDAEAYGMSRDELYFKMREANVLGRRYFYPLISEFSTYRGLPSASADNLPVATRLANEVICLPMHHQLSTADIDRILSIILDAKK